MTGGRSYDTLEDLAVAIRAEAVRAQSAGAEGSRMTLLLCNGAMRDLATRIDGGGQDTPEVHLAELSRARRTLDNAVSLRLEMETRLERRHRREAGWIYGCAVAGVCAAVFYVAFMATLQALGS